MYESHETAPFLSIESLARRWGLHYLTVWGYVSRREIPAVKLGGRWRIALDDVKAVETPSK